MVMGALKRAVTLALALASLLGAPALHAESIVRVPPEPRVSVPHRTMPEDVMTQANLARDAAERAEPVKDAQGRTRYIIDLTDDAPLSYSNTLAASASDKLPSWHKPQMRNLAAQMGAQYSFTPTAITSWVGNSVTAFLTADQLVKLASDARVTRITPDYKLTLSASLWSDAGGGELTSWGTQAVSGGVAPVPNPVTVYVLDAGVGYHTDLPSVSQRLSANPGINPVGCYQHSTHLAGIIGAARNGYGSVGVFPSVPIESVSTNNANDINNNCSFRTPTTLDQVASFYVQGLDLIKSRVSISGRVGVVNISSNTGQCNDIPCTPNIFAIGQTVGDKITSVATPAPGYPGAFVVQSAGNFFGNACSYAYTGATQFNGTYDGVMVVGAIDNNGQPVVPLNGVVGFRNSPNAGDQPGSNYGACIEAWAPGNRIYSSWASYPQSASIQYNAAAYLSGTSMAAPHVAGVAAYLATVQGLTTPSAIESSVRNYLRLLGSQDASGNSLKLPNLGGYSFTALPTAEFAIDGTHPANVNASITKYSDQSFALSYASVGATNCSLAAYRNTVLWYSIPNYQASYSWGSVKLAPAKYQWTIDCVSAQGTHNYASASANILAPPTLPKATFYVNGTDASTQTYFSVAAGQSFTLRYASTNASYCNLSANKNGVPWYSNPNFQTSYNWGSVVLDPGTYDWMVQCFDSSGHSAYAHAEVVIS